ncbi:hypothetical protein FGO68_gene4567 [Halteria grandinella]|uniref:Uncharacterized protein n=1 Tax=Halteria grandinella TaxID=5974 RepID=A0A8J8NAF8_HALGN|nr:hypothetical protein FGO68_gene4567 [Halteria grandinella]
MDAADYPLISPTWVTHVSRLPMASLMRIGWSPYLRITLRQANESRRLGGSTFERRLSVKNLLINMPVPNSDRQQRAPKGNQTRQMLVRCPSIVPDEPFCVDPV